MNYVNLLLQKMADASSTVLSQILRKRRLDDSKSSAVGRCSPPRKDFAIPTHYFEPAKLTRQLLILHEHFPQLAAAVLSLVKSNLSQDEASPLIFNYMLLDGGINQLFCRTFTNRTHRRTWNSARRNYMKISIYLEGLDLRENEREEKYMHSDTYRWGKLDSKMYRLLRKFSWRKSPKREAEFDRTKGIFFSLNDGDFSLHSILQSPFKK